MKNGNDFTPGPWAIKPMKDKLYVESEYINALTPFVCDTQRESCMSDEERETCDANAHLIAAAPAMLEALEAIEPMTWNDSPLLKVYAKEIEQLRAAIAQAKGEGR